MSVSNSNTGGTKFKFVTSDGGISQKRSQVTQACEYCRKRKKRCNHTERSSGVTSHVRHSPSATSPSSTSQAAPIESPANSTSHQFPTSSGLDEGQYHAETSLTTSNPVERNGKRTEPVGATEQNHAIWVCRYFDLVSSSFITSCDTWKGLSFADLTMLLYCVTINASAYILYIQMF
jgi:hypothetical protein